MNIFEGSRRIAKVTAALYLGGFVVGAMNGGFTEGDGFDFSGFFLGLTAGLAFIWAFTLATGWIVRGFMCTPQGKDSKE